mmetsp:Transcript_30838/g.92387  ORF Transcript_30838/g.92387 Transcript_30838/m.92387 type:complete len:508 (+) Transcript_30838:554-2077(+)
MAVVEGVAQYRHVLQGRVGPQSVVRLDGVCRVAQHHRPPSHAQSRSRVPERGEGRRPLRRDVPHDVVAHQIREARKFVVEEGPEIRGVAVLLREFVVGLHEEEGADVPLLVGRERLQGDPIVPGSGRIVEVGLPVGRHAYRYRLVHPGVGILVPRHPEGRGGEQPRRGVQFRAPLEVELLHGVGDRAGGSVGGDEEIGRDQFGPVHVAGLLRFGGRLILTVRRVRILAPRDAEDHGAALLTFFPATNFLSEADRIDLIAVHQIDVPRVRVILEYVMMQYPHQLIPRQHPAGNVLPRGSLHPVLLPRHARLPIPPPPHGDARPLEIVVRAEAAEGRLTPMAQPEEVESRDVAPDLLVLGGGGRVRAALVHGDSVGRAVFTGEHDRREEARGAGSHDRRIVTTGGDDGRRRIERIGGVGGGVGGGGGYDEGGIVRRRGEKGGESARGRGGATSAPDDGGGGRRRRRRREGIGASDSDSESDTNTAASAQPEEEQGREDHDRTGCAGQGG